MITNNGLSALFVDRRPTRDVASNVDVVVKRKRTLLPDADVIVEGQVSPEEAAARAPRVFRVDNPAQPASEQIADRPNVWKPRTRRRRVLHGEVRTIRPVRTDFDTQLEEPSDTDPAILDFGVAEEERRTYTKLMNAIARLEREAKAVKEVDAAAAVRWIRKAIAEYGLSASDLGF